MHQGTQPPPDLPPMHQHHIPVGDKVPSGRPGPGVPGMDFGGGGGGELEGPVGGGPMPTMGSYIGSGGGGTGVGLGGGPIGGGGPVGPGPIENMGSHFGSGESGGGGPVGGLVGPIDGKEKNPWANGWDPDWEEGDELMARGGIVTKPTRVRLGEQGPEAVRKLRPENYEVGERPMTYLRRSGR